MQSKKSVDEYEKEDKSFDLISTKYITGYNAKWNLKKMSFSAIKAGSTFVYELDQDADIDIGLLGEKQHEGFGEYLVENLSDMEYFVETADNEIVNDEKEMRDELLHNIKEELSDVLLDSMYTDMMNKSVSDRKELNKITSSFLGRIILMVKQAKDKNDLMDRIKSVKNKNKKDRIIAYITKTIGEENEPVRLNCENTEECSLLRKMNVSDDYISQRWKEYLIRLLTQEKYLQKGESQGDEGDDE